MADLTAEEERFFFRLMVQCDDYGRFDGRPAVVRARCFPLQLDTISESDVSTWMQRMVDVGLIQPYVVDGRRYIQVVTWERHQQTRAKNSKFPDPLSNVSNGQNLIADDSERNQIPSYPEARSDIRETISGSEEAASSEPPNGADAPSPLRCAALSPEQKSRADTFSQTLTGINGFQPTPDFLVKVVTKYEAVDLEESALAIAGYAKKRPKWLTNAAILNWLRKDLERLNTPPPERTGRNGTDHGPMKQRAPTHAPISDEAREYVRSLGSGVPS
jgi:hypothetical protein